MKIWTIEHRFSAHNLNIEIPWYLPHIYRDRKKQDQFEESPAKHYFCKSI